MLPITGHGTQGFTTNVVLSHDCAAWLDEQGVQIRRDTGASVNRSRLLRGIVTGVMNSGMDFAHCRTEKEVGALLAFILVARGSREGR